MVETSSLTSVRSAPPSKFFRPRSHSITNFLAAEQIKLINKVYHAIVVDTVILVDRTDFRCQLTGNIALVMQDIVQLKAQGSGSLKHALGDLDVPNQFVAIHTGIPVSSAALIDQIGRKCHAPR